jgi:hypothetical protein
MAPNQATLVKDPPAHLGTAKLQRPKQLDDGRALQLMFRATAGEPAQRPANAHHSHRRNPKRTHATYRPPRGAFLIGACHGPGHYLQLVEETVARLCTHDEHQALAILDAETDNIRGALRWALQAEPQASLRLVGRLGYCWQARCDLDGLDWLDAALRAAGERQPGPKIHGR